jgi:hypothetical protein
MQAFAQQNGQQKTYIVLLDDESGSMVSLRTAATKDHNTTVTGIKDSATKYQQDTIVSNFGFGSGEVRRYVVNSNPHVLAPKTSWVASGGTPGRKAIREAIELLKTMPDYNSPNVAFAIFTTTDGEFDGDYWDNNPTTKEAELAHEIAELTRTGRWTFVFRVPKGGRKHLAGLRIPAGNVQEWETTAAGMAASTVQTTQAFDTFFATRATGKTSSTVFYADATNVDTSKLVDISKRTSLYVVEDYENGIQIRDFILKRRQRYLKGSAFYQLSKTEKRVGPNKMLAIRDRTTGVVYAGKEARTMLGLSSVDNITLHPGNHGNYDIFVQSESVNRKLVKGYGVIYWEEIGVPFTQEEIDRFTGVKPAAPVAPAKPAVVQLPAVPVSTRPTPSPLKPTPKTVPAPVTQVAVGLKPVAFPAVNGRVRYHLPTADALFYSTRDVAREVAQSLPGKKQYDAGPTAPYGRRFFVAAA